MTEILITTVAGVSLLVGFSFFIVWYGEYSKRKAKYRYFKKFEFIDKYIAETDRPAEDVLEGLSAERRVVFSDEREVLNVIPLEDKVVKPS